MVVKVAAKAVTGRYLAIGSQRQLERNELSQRLGKGGGGTPTSRACLSTAAECATGRVQKKTPFHTSLGTKSDTMSRVRMFPPTHSFASRSSDCSKNSLRRWSWRWWAFAKKSSRSSQCSFAPGE